MDIVSMYQMVQRKNAWKEFWGGTQLNPLGVTAHTYLETGNYKHVLGNNFAGIKCTKGWLDRSIHISNGKCMNAKTKEYMEGKQKIIAGAFRVYDDVGHFFLDYSRLIHLYYDISRDNWDCVWGYIGGLHKKWATDPDYFYKLTDIVFAISSSLLKENYTKQLIDDYKKAVARGELQPEMLRYIEERLP